METTSLIQEPQKKQKLNEEDDVDGNSQCLGDLPEDILQHILSFLSTKDAVRTSVLSKSWEYRWTFIPNLDFERSKPYKRNLLMNFVQRMLCLRDSYAIRRFTLTCDVLNDASLVNTCITTAVRHNVQELYIRLGDIPREFSLPRCLFTCKTLTSLHLRMPAYYILKLPTTICFSNLKTLTIYKVKFSDEYLTQQFFSSMPVLEELHLYKCFWGVLKVVHLSAPKLHSLSITELERHNSSYRGDGCQVMIFAVSLIEFVYNGGLFHEFCLYESSSLEKAEINAIPDNASAQFAYKILIGLSNVKLLSLSYEVVQVLADAAVYLSHMPMFNNLTDLVFFESSTVDIRCVGLLRILQNSPYLETMKFFEGISLCLYDNRMIGRLLPCFLSHLKWIEVCHYYGNCMEFSAMKILLKNAVVLDEIVIHCSKPLAGDLERQKNLYKQLIEIPKGSQNCKIILK